MASVRVCGLLHGRVEQAHEEAQVGAEHAEPQTGSVRQAALYNTRVCHNTRQAGEGGSDTESEMWCNKNMFKIKTVLIYFAYPITQTYRKNFEVDI